MTAPDTNINTQKRRHRGPLVGIAAAGIFVVLLIVFLPYGDDAETTGDTPQGVSSQNEAQGLSGQGTGAGALRNPEPANDPLAAPVR